MNTDKMLEAGIDYEQGLARFAGKAELYEMFLNKFLEDINYANLMEELEENHLEQAFKAAHSLKGVSGNLSLNKLYEKTAALVDALRGGQTEKLVILTEAVKKCYAETVAAILA